jgi:hypothetical protein
MAVKTLAQLKATITTLKTHALGTALLNPVDVFPILEDMLDSMKTINGNVIAGGATDIVVGSGGTITVATTVTDGGTDPVSGDAVFEALKAYIAASVLTTKGDTLVRTSTGVVRLPVGTNGQVMEADSANANGMKWVTPTAGGGDQLYNAGGGCFVVATGAGVTFTRAGNVFTINVPTGVRLKAFSIQSTAGEFPGVSIELTINRVGNTLTNQGWSTAIPPHAVEFWHMEAGARFPYITNNDGDPYATGHLRPTITAAGGGNISMLYALPAGVTTGETLLMGQYNG